MTKIETMADRIKQVAGTKSSAEIARQVTLHGVATSSQGAHKWLNGGGIDEDTLEAFCRAYGSTPAYIRYGVRPIESLSQRAMAAAEAAEELPPEIIQEAFDFVGYKLKASEPLFAKEHFARYMAMIDKLTVDRKKKP